MRKAMLVMLLLSIPAGDLVAAERSAVQEKVVKGVTEKKDWIAEAEKCPATVAPASPPARSAANHCKKDNLECLSKCEAGEGYACYWLAHEIQTAKIDAEAVAQALYQRACKLGVPSGCTNRAAGLILQSPADTAVQQCVATTFEKTCALRDSWGCVMYGQHLARGVGVKQDPASALRVLDGACGKGKAGAACSRAEILRKEIREAQGR